MTLFIIGTVIFSLFSLAFTIFLALWTYEDAKVKSDSEQPLIWVLIVLLANPIGIIVYLLAGRRKKDVPAPKKWKTAVIASLIGLVLSTGLFAAAAVSFTIGELSTGFGSIRSGRFTMSSSSMQNGVWTFRARTANGSERRSPNLSAAQLENLHVLSDSGNGVQLRLEQNGTSQTIDISGFFDQTLDLSAFQPGNVRITLQFDRANDVDVIIDWRG